MATRISDSAAGRRPTLRTGFRVQIRVIGALMLRELHTRYGRENIGYLWLILEPMLLATAIGLLHARSASHFGSDVKPVPLALIGYCNFMTFRSIFNRAEGAIEGNLPLMYHRTISIFDILAARSILEAAGTWLAFAILIGLATVVGIANPPERPLFLALGMLLMLLFSFSLSMVICGATHENRALGRLTHPVSYLMLPLSGAFFSMDFVPSSIRELLLWIPLAHIFEILRYGWFKSATLEYVDWLYLTGWIVFPFLGGLLALSVVRKKIYV